MVTGDHQNGNYEQKVFHFNDPFKLARLSSLDGTSALFVRCRTAGCFASTFAQLFGSLLLYSEPQFIAVGLW